MTLTPLTPPSTGFSADNLVFAATIGGHTTTHILRRGVSHPGAQPALWRHSVMGVTLHTYTFAWRSAPSVHPRTFGEVPQLAVFYSFHYERDAWRVQQIINMGVIEGQPILTAQKWEEVKKQGDQAIKNWIAEQMKYKTAVVVLVGAQTAGREWVRYEIGYAWDNYKPLVGIRINGLADGDGKTDSPGANPFESVTLDGGGTVGDHVTLWTPSGSTSQEVYASIKANLQTWVNGARGRKRQS
ncbi:TIR domain-containing protein [Mycobacterium marseillense]|nr:TIR domain-containing protein [Mycobacterium marseillense]